MHKTVGILLSWKIVYQSLKRLPIVCTPNENENKIITRMADKQRSMAFGVGVGVSACCRIFIYFFLSRVNLGNIHIFYSLVLFPC